MRRWQAIWSVAGALALAASRAEAQAPAPPPPEPQPAPEQWAPPQPVEEKPTTTTTSEPAPPPEGGQPVTPEPTPTAGAPASAPPEQIANTSDESQEVDIYGFAMLDGGFDFGHIGNPDWQDVLRPTKLPAFENEFGRGRRTFLGVRQSRFGVSMKTPTSEGEIFTKFEFEMFGTGVDAGQTTFRLRHFYGEWQGLRAGQTWSPFMDPDVFPDSIEYWGPPGMVFFRNVQLAYTPISWGESHITIALERPGASADQGRAADRIELENVVGRFPAPDVSAEAKWVQPWGHLKLSAIFRYIKWDDLAEPPVVQGHAYGWGVNASGNIKIKPVLLKLQAVYGHAIENYMNDAPADVGVKNASGPIEGKALPVLGIVAFADIAWNDYFTSTVGYSLVRIWNSDGQLPDAFHMGQYALGNILYHPTKSLFFGPEFQWGRRSNNDDGFKVNDYRIQFSVKYSFSYKVGGKP